MSRGSAIEHEIDSFIRPELRHHRHRTDALYQRADIAECVKQAYRSFSDAAETGSIDQDVFAGFAAAGVNRVSIGVQSFDEAALIALKLSPCARLTVCSAFKKSLNLARFGGWIPIPYP